MILIRISWFVILIVLVSVFVGGVVLGGRYISNIFDLFPANEPFTISNPPAPTSISEPTPPAKPPPTSPNPGSYPISNEVSWSYKLTGFYGSRWDAWEAHVKGKVPGLTWRQFKDEVLIHNPQLETDGYVFKSEKEYLLPQVN